MTNKTKQKHENQDTSIIKQLLFRMFSAKSHFLNICCKIYSQIDFELWRVKLQSKVPEGK